MSDEETRELEKRLISILEKAEENASPWKRPGWWASWASVITVIIVSVSFIVGLLAEEQFRDFSKSRGLYATEKQYAHKGVIELAHAHDSISREVAALSVKLDEVLRELKTLK